MSYVCNTTDDRERMLRTIGAAGIDDLFSDVPEAMRFAGRLALPEALSEVEAARLLGELGEKNVRPVSFLGAGAYSHYIPAVVDALASRSEFYTSYTPYQPEVSQGTLIVIFEFQTFICRLTGMDVANASLYDGATSLAESVLMSLRTTGRSAVVVSDCLHPHYRDVLRTYCWANDVRVIELPSAGGVMDPEAVAGAVTGEVSAVVVQNPGFFGCIQEVAPLAGIAHGRGAHLVVAVTEPLSLGLLKAPGSLGADIVCGEAGPFGNPVGFGGPALGFLAARAEFLRRLPGRLVGKSVDAGGKEAYVLTLQTREQHIRREKSTSNICTNQGLCALRAVLYLAALGNNIRDLAALNHRLASYCRRGLIGKGFEGAFDRPYFNEFVVRRKGAKGLMARLREEGFLLGVDLGGFHKGMEDHVLVCCTEMNTPAEVDQLVNAVGNLG